MDQAALLAELEPEAARLMDRHLSVAKEWFPHEMVPYSRGRDFEKGRDWQPGDADFGGAGSEIDEAVRAALFVNLLTEDNLPFYFRDIDRIFGSDSAFGAWSRNWTAEEGRHSIVMRDYFTVTRAVDPVALERARMIQVRGGEVPAPTDALEALAYVSMQELATRISHRNTGKLMTDPIGTEIMSRVGNDENLHYLFYRDLTAAALQVDPSATVIGIERAVRNFAMPGTGIPDFPRLAREIARAGIYDLLIHHDQILEPVIMRHWRLEEVTGLSDEAERARESLFELMRRTAKIGRRLATGRAEPVAS
ncbi:MAG: acyl-ACP desaturase [Acidobacteria bacterium]|nr:acyl-ACP desaturase [Acidobacteriota bacterium]